MTTRRPAAHVLIWRDPTGGANAGAGPMFGWQEYRRPDHGTLFQKRSDPGWIRPVAARVLSADFGAITRNTNVTVAWQPERPDATPAADLEPIFRRVRPMTLICPERPTGDRWVISTFGAPQILHRGAVQAAIDDMVASMFPEWRHGLQFSPRGLMLRHDVSAEDMGIIEPATVSPDEICASVSEDPEVIAAVQRWDRATPSTWRDLVAARLAAQARAGVAPDKRAPLYSGQVEEFLTPILMRAGRGDEPMILAHLRQSLRRTYGEHAETVLMFMLRSYAHGGTEKLLALASSKAAA
jgi:hypothetical protein